ncbi:hypothetical protein ACOMHN_029096 [Nucella lapillus]
MNTVVGIDLDLDSQEVNRVCDLFHRSLRYTVTRVVRIQSPRLWAQYYKKSKKMERERGGLRPLEYRLFHGTDSANVDSISSKGFEVGRAGSHRGVLYGRGIYFAKDSCLAHLYTACKIPTGCPHLLTKTPLISSAVMDTREFHQIDYRHGWKSAHPLITATECMDSEGEEVTFSDQEDVMAKKSDLNISVHDHSYELPFFQEHLVTPVMPRTSGKQKRTSGGKRCSSSGYSYTMKVGCRHYMFLCSVLVGSTVEGIPSDFMPPLKDPDDPNSRRHDSCYGCRNNVLEFAVFRSNQVYPEYLIEYNHNGAVVMAGDGSIVLGLRGLWRRQGWKGLIGYVSLNYHQRLDLWGWTGVHGP